VVAKDFDEVADLCIGAGNIDHSLVHTDITDDGAALTADEDGAAVVGEATIEAIGIADRDHSNLAVLLERSMPSIADCFARRDGFNREDGGFKRADIAQLCAREGEAIEAYTQTAHIELVGREAFDSGGVADMLDKGLMEAILERLGASGEVGDLGEGEGIELLLVGTSQVAKDGVDLELVLCVQLGDQFGDLLLVEAKAVHTRVDFNMDRIVLESFLLGREQDIVEALEGIDIGLEVILEDKVHGWEFGVHDNNGEGDTGLTELDPLVGHSDGEVIDQATVLEGTRDLDGSSAIGEGFDHTGELSRRF